MIQVYLLFRIDHFLHVNLSTCVYQPSQPEVGSPGKIIDNRSLIRSWRCIPLLLIIRPDKNLTRRAIAGHCHHCHHDSPEPARRNRVVPGVLRQNKSTNQFSVTWIKGRMGVVGSPSLLNPKRSLLLESLNGGNGGVLTYPNPTTSYQPT